MSRWGFPALAFVTGAAVTVYEFAAANFFRAWFGQTVYVWANVIGVILFALALGYTAGGRLADRTSTLAPLASVLAFAGGYGLLVGWMGPSVCSWLAGPEEVPQDAAIPAFIAESLAATLLLFGPPLMALGMATPLLVQRASASWPVGRASGLVFGVGTAGSIAGIYATTFLFLLWWSVRATITGASAVLLVLGVLGFVRAGRTRALALLLPLGLFPLGLAPPWDELPPDGARLVTFRETPYQLVRVVDRPPEGGKVHRWLAFDEGMGTYHSMQVEGAWTGAYYDAFAALPDWLPGDGPLRVLVIGNAAGTMSRLLHIHSGERELLIDGVEIDPGVTEVAREAMGLRDEDHRRIVHGDGRAFLRISPEASYDAIFLDAFARQVSIPATLATKEFFALARSRLREGGLLLCNIGALRPGSLLVKTLADTAAAGFGTPVALAPLGQDQQNVLLVCARGGPPPAPPSSIAHGAAESFARHVPGEGLVLTDDFCPVETLTARDLELR